MNIRPKLQLLGPEQIQDIHRYSIRILEDTGIKVESKKALEIFRKSDGIKNKAAKLLKINTSTLYYKLEKFDLLK